MVYQKINVLAELRKLATGEPTKAPADLIAVSAIPLVRAGMREKDVEELERLYTLSDKRNA